MFEEFKPTSAQDWKNQIIKELKGEPYENLIWKNENGFDVNPFYISEDCKIKYEPAFTHCDWTVSVKVKGNNSKSKNKNLLRDLNHGASAFQFRLKNHSLEVALKDVSLPHIRSSFFADEKEIVFLKNYLLSLPDHENVCSALFNSDFNSQRKMKSWFDNLNEIKHLGNISTVSFDSTLYHNYGAYAAYEVAIIFSGIVEQIEFLTSTGKMNSSDIVIKCGVNSDYFIQIAKLRAIRRLWNIIKKEFKIKNEIYLIAETSKRNKSINGNYNNLSRTTVEAMAAVAGGCSELLVNGFDVFFKTTSELAQRMSINQQLILKEESHLNKMADVCCGSYYIENLTDLIVEKALEHFKYFELNGGYFSLHENNLFKIEIAKQALMNSATVKQKKKIVVGVNAFVNEASGKSNIKRDDLIKYILKHSVADFEIKNGMVNA